MNLTLKVNPVGNTFILRTVISDGLELIYDNMEEVEEANICQAMIDATIIYENMAALDIIPVSTALLADTVDANDPIQQMLGVIPDQSIAQQPVKMVQCSQCLIVIRDIDFGEKDDGDGCTSSCCAQCGSNGYYNIGVDGKRCSLMDAIDVADPCRTFKNLKLYQQYLKE